MEYENLKSSHAWETMPCQKNEKCYHCKCKKQYDSIPKENFIVIDINPEDDSRTERTVTKLKIHYGNNDEVLGWIY